MQSVFVNVWVPALSSLLAHFHHVIELLRFRQGTLLGIFLSAGENIFFTAFIVTSSQDSRKMHFCSSVLQCFSFPTRQCLEPTQPSSSSEQVRGSSSLFFFLERPVGLALGGTIKFGFSEPGCPSLGLRALQKCCLSSVLKQKLTRDKLNEINLPVRNFKIKCTGQPSYEPTDVCERGFKIIRA